MLQGPCAALWRLIFPVSVKPDTVTGQAWCLSGRIPSSYLRGMAMPGSSLQGQGQVVQFFCVRGALKMVGCGAERSGVCAGPCAASCERLVSSLHGLQRDAHPGDTEVQAEVGRCAAGLWCLLRVFLHV